VTIAVTGPLASGKSTIVDLLGELGAETVSADEVVHYLLAEDDETITRVVERFGEEVRGESGIDRKALGRVVFGDTEALSDLEEILHPRVREEMERRAAGSGADLFVAEIPLLFEGGGEERFDLAVAVTSPEERRQAWVEERGMEEEQRRAIEDRQFSQEEKARRADVVVENDGDLDKLREQAKVLVDRVLGERGSGEGGAEEA
ncbi:MAG: dephospho-CoA kinase, partial [Actinomycetota bacterium]|nr:dephospho-CoA kinase [Actinomycetota bacterium]